MWNAHDMHDMLYDNNYADSPLFTNAAAANNVTFMENTFVNRSASQAWPAVATAIMSEAGIPKIRQTLVPAADTELPYALLCNLSPNAVVCPLGFLKKQRHESTIYSRAPRLWL